MYYRETSTQQKVDASPPALNGGWWSPYQLRALTVLDLTNKDSPVRLLTTSKVHYENDLLSGVVIWTRSR